ncbi:unnamed protein product [Cuscuta epithymum]|uniref:Uncharacterized protein n=1 Tax=Cuscuta epithymum TaxID=186058 RepID=A0AAV0FIG4_9ASTE|nr:unnamed protein product [Cuscuta epithymum]
MLSLYFYFADLIFGLNVRAVRGFRGRCFLPRVIPALRRDFEKAEMEEMVNKCDNMILEGDEDDLILDKEVAGKEEALNRSQRVKEDEEMLICPPPEPPPWRSCATRVWTTISSSILLCVFTSTYMLFCLSCMLIFARLLH